MRSASKLFPRRIAGVLLHPTSLPGELGNGDLGHNAYRFVDFLHASGLGIWQMLPHGPTHDDGSPYQSLSVHAGNPLWISLDPLIASRWIYPSDADSTADGPAVRKEQLQLAHRGFEYGASTEDREGYYWGINTIEGTDKFKGHTMKIFFKNENHVTWLDDQVYVTSPDIIEVVALKTAEPITNTDLKKGDTVAVIGAKNEKYRTKEGIEIIGPKHYGYDIEYVPIENRVK